MANVYHEILGVANVDIFNLKILTTTENFNKNYSTVIEINSTINIQYI